MADELVNGSSSESTKQDSKPDGPNGFTKLVRRILSILSMIAFFSLVLSDFVFGITVRQVPIWLYVLLFSAAAAGWDPVFKILAVFSGFQGRK